MEAILKDKKIVIGITGGIAAYKAADIVSSLNKEGAQTKVIMTTNALEFIKPLTLETLSGYPVYHDMYLRSGSWEIDHISIAKWADLFLVAPATANILGKVCHGIADDLLSTTIMATKSPVMFAPAMNTQMYNNDIVQDNIKSLKERGYIFIPPDKGRLACGDWGQGKLADTQHMIQTIKDYLGRNQDLKGIRILVTAGPTREYLDPVRFISNPSTGKMGFAIAAACVERGAEVDLVAGPTHISPPVGVHMYPVETAQQMYENVIKLYPHCDIVFKTAAVGDYRPKVYQSNKIKKENEQLSLLLIKNPDILKELGRRKEGQVLVGFAAETQDIRDYAIIKLHEKNLDFILANDVTQPGAGFKGDTNQGILFTRQGDAVPIPLLDKKEFAHRLIDEVVQRTAGLCIDIEGKKL